MKTLKIKDETHRKLLLIKAKNNLKSIDRVIDNMIENDPIYMIEKITGREK